MDKRRDRALKKVSARAESRGVLRTTRQKTSTIQAVKAEQSHSKHKLYRLFRRNISTENINYIQAVQSHRKHQLYSLFHRKHKLYRLLSPTENINYTGCSGGTVPQIVDML